MKKNITLICLCISFFCYAQKRELPADTIVITNHSTIIKGEKLNYQAQTGTQPIWDIDGNPIASLFYTYYKRTDIKNGGERPLIFSFNGGSMCFQGWGHVLTRVGPCAINDWSIFFQ